MGCQVTTVVALATGLSGGLKATHCSRPGPVVQRLLTEAVIHTDFVGSAVRALPTFACQRRMAVARRFRNIHNLITVNVSYPIIEANAREIERAIQGTWT
jgi:hypothetical protein